MKYWHRHLKKKYFNHKKSIQRNNKVKYFHKSKFAHSWNNANFSDLKSNTTEGLNGLGLQEITSRSKYVHKIAYIYIYGFKNLLFHAKTVVSFTVSLGSYIQPTFSLVTTPSLQYCDKNIYVTSHVPAVLSHSSQHVWLTTELPNFSHDLRLVSQSFWSKITGHLPFLKIRSKSITNNTLHTIITIVLEKKKFVNHILTQINICQLFNHCLKCRKYCPLYVITVN